MIHRKLIILILTAISVLLVITPLYAATAPDSNNLLTKYKAQNVLTDGDALYIALYDLTYASLPTEPMYELYTGSLIVYDSDGDQTGAPTLSDVPFTDVNPEDGFGYGIWSIYFEVDPYTAASAASGTVKLCNEPNATTGPSGSRHCEDHSSIDSTFDLDESDEKNLFQEAILGLGEFLEESWGEHDDDIDVVDVSTDFRVFTEDGENYIVHAIPGIRSLLPDAFVSGTAKPAFTPDEERDTTYETEKKNFFAGTELDIQDGSGSSLDLIGDVVGLDSNPQLVGTVLVMLVACGIAFFCIQVTNQATMGLFAAILVLQVGAFVGLVSFAITAVLALIGALALGYIFFYKSSTS